MKNLFVISCLLLLLTGCATITEQKHFPDPFVISAGHSQVTFTDLYALCTIEVFTLNGDLLRSMTESDGDGQLVWDVKNENGEDLTGGMYLYIIRGAEEVRSGKLIITK